MNWLLLLALASQQPTLPTEIEGRPHKLVIIRPEPTAPEGFTLLEQEWVVLDKRVDWKAFDGGSTFVCTAPNGQYEIRWRGQWVKTEPLEGKSEWRVYALSIRGPPDPEPQPIPPEPDPVPVPTDVPFPTPGLSVLIIREASGPSLLPQPQQDIFSSAQILQFARNCVQVPGGTDKFFRIWDDDYTDVDLISVPSSLRVAYRMVLNQANGRVPWIAVSTGTRGYTGPLPGTVEETLALLRKYQ